MHFAYEWPIFLIQLTTVGLNGVSSDYVRPILDVFGPELHQLEIKFCHGIKLTDLALCTQLEGLSILKSCFNTDESESAVNANFFLPQLKSFKSDFCLGNRSQFFEDKASLVLLDVVCSHIEAERGEVHENVSKVLLKYTNFISRQIIFFINNLSSFLASL